MAFRRSAALTAAGHIFQVFSIACVVLARTSVMPEQVLWLIQTMIGSEVAYGIHRFPARSTANGMPIPVRASSY